MNTIRYFALIAAASTLMSLGQPAFAAPAPAASGSPAPAAAAKASVATASGPISTFSTGKYVTLKNANPKAKNVTYYINKSTVITGTLAKGASATVTYNPNVAAKTKIWAVKIVVTAAAKK